MADIELKGMGVAMVTPFKSDKSIDFEALGQLIDHLIDNHADYIVVLGTTAETPTLFDSEKKAVLRYVVGRVNKRVPLVAGIGGNNTQAVIQEIKSRDLKGYDAILSVTPFYNKPKQDGIFEHFSAISSASRLPIILYNIPSRTGVNMTAETTLRLASKHKNIIGIKEASGNIEQVKEILAKKMNNFAVISGDDALALQFIKGGADGVISVVGNAFPKEYGSMIRLALDNNYSRASVINKRFENLYHHVFSEGNPAGIKCLLKHLGIISDELRLPLTPVTPYTSEQIQKTIKEIF